MLVRFARDTSRHGSMTILLVVFVVTLTAIFHAFPGIDLSVSRLFCSPPAGTGSCNGFAANDIGLLKIIRSVLLQAPVVAMFLLLAQLVWSELRDLPSWARPVDATLAAAFLLGPILIVNLVLKAYSGRPRPYQTLDFGGDLVFTAAGDFTGACIANCSFVSGEAAAAGWMLWLLPLVLVGSGLRFRLAAVLIVTASLLTPLLRVAMGGHYLSDAILGWIIGFGAYPLTAVLAKTWRGSLPRLATGS